jgi:hypothetical protein
VNPEAYFLKSPQTVPGFAADENAEELGSHLVLPPSYEPYRKDFEKTLPPIYRLNKKGITG